MRPNLSALASLVALLAMATPRDAAATPWVLPEGLTVLRLGGGVDFADSEYLPDGTHQSYPLDGRFESYYAEIEGRYGLAKRLEVGLKLQFKGVSYNSDPLLNPPDDANPGLRDYREEVISFSRRDIGLADIYLSANVQHLTGAVNLASGLVLKLPSGYTSPQETFADGQPSQNVQDDVTLGDGKTSLEYRLHLGRFFSSTLTLFQLSAGYEARFNGPGHRAVGTLKLGQGVEERLFFFLGANTAITVFEGEPIGTGFVAVDPEVSALDFTAENVEVIDATLDASYLTAEFGALLRLGDRELTLSVSRVLWGKNFPELTSVGLGTILIFD